MQDFSMYFGLGWEHIISRDALDRILFIVALALIYRLTDWKKVLVLVTAFTIGHFLTLFLSVKDIIRADPRWVEFLIPLTIIITAVVNMFQKNFERKGLRVNYFLALFFGLIHGLGYANAIRFVLADDQSLGWSLFAFNIGLEIGQIFVVLTVLLISEAILRNSRFGRRKWVIIISSLILYFSLNMLIDRIPKF
jgi:hypothetical protein